MKIAKAFLLMALLCPVISQAQAAQPKLSEEEAAIMAVITEQTRAYFERDYEAWLNAHVTTDYYTEHKYWNGWSEKVRTTRGWKAHEAQAKKRFDPTKPKSKWNEAQYIRSDINIRISKSGDMAWAAYSQKAVDPETGDIVGESYETRVMEKHDGQWKIAYLGYHYLPKENPPAHN